MNPDVFKSTPCDNCPHKEIKAEKRRLPYILRYEDDIRLVKLTPDQVNLLDYLVEAGMLSSYVEYEYADSTKWEEI